MVSQASMSSLGLEFQYIQMFYYYDVDDRCFRVQASLMLHQRGKKQLTVDVLPMLLLVDGHLMSLLVLSRSSQIQRLSDALGMRHIPPTNMFPLVNGQPNRHLTSDGQPLRLQSLPNKKRSRLLISCYWSRIALPYGHWWHRFTHLPPSRHQTHAHRRFH